MKSPSWSDMARRRLLGIGAVMPARKGGDEQGASVEFRMYIENTFLTDGIFLFPAPIVVMSQSVSPGEFINFGKTHFHLDHRLLKIVRPLKNAKRKSHFNDFHKSAIWRLLDVFYAPVTPGKLCFACFTPGIDLR